MKAKATMNRPKPPPKATVYHLINASALEAIQQAKWDVIEPRSHPFWSSRYDEGGRQQLLEKASNHHNVDLNISKVKNIMRRDTFNVCLNDPQATAWKQVRLGQDLIEHITGKDFESVEKLYSVKCHADVRELYIRDHYYASPAYYEKQYGKDLWTAFCNDAQRFYDNPSHEGTLAFFEGLARYFASTTPYEEYDGSFVCEELWYGRPIDVPKTSNVKEITDGVETFHRG